MIGYLSVGGADPCEHALVCEQRFGARGDVWQLQRGCPCLNVESINQSIYQHLSLRDSNLKGTGL